MERRDTFGVHFVMRRMPSGKNFIYARIVINGTASELAVKQQIEEKGTLTHQKVEEYPTIEKDSLFEWKMLVENVTN